LPDDHRRRAPLIYREDFVMGITVMGNSKAELLAWMKGSSKTLGWDALVAFDRATINDVFREQYITGFTAGSYFPTISNIESLAGNDARLFDECVLSEPLLSFDNASVVDPLQ
jgi:hypothetical protein